jgi:hypothetical protein
MYTVMAALVGACGLAMQPEPPKGTESAPAQFNSTDPEETLRWIVRLQTALADMARRDNDLATKRAEKAFDDERARVVGKRIDWTVQLNKVTSDAVLFRSAAQIGERDPGPGGRPGKFLYVVGVPLAKLSPSDKQWLATLRPGNSIRLQARVVSIRPDDGSKEWFRVEIDGARLSPPKSVK